MPREAARCVQRTGAFRIASSTGTEDSPSATKMCPSWIVTCSCIERAANCASVRLGGMARDRQRMLAIIAAVDVGNEERGFANRGLLGHGDRAIGGADIAILTYNCAFSAISAFHLTKRPNRRWRPRSDAVMNGR